MHLIGVNGFKRSGKGTVANIVSAIYNDGDANILQVGFADKLKVLGARTLGLMHDEETCITMMDDAKESWTIRAAKDVLFDCSWPVTTISGRQYLQNIGNEARGLFGEDFWIDMVLPDPAAVEGWDSDRNTLLERRYPDVDCLVITDLRYPNEAQRVKSLGGVVWEVLRPGLSSDGHASETPLPRELVDWTIPNDGDLSELRQEVEDAMAGTLR